MRPALRLINALVGWAVLGLIVAFGLLPAQAWWSAGAVLLVIGIVDALQLRRTQTPAVQRYLPAVLPLGPGRDVALAVQNDGDRLIDLELHDLHPADWPVDGLPRRLTIAPGNIARFDYRLTPIARGQFSFAGCHLAIYSPLKLWTSRRTADANSQVSVFPNFAPLARFTLHSAEQATRIVGAHLRRRRGDGTEFHQMREYRVGDSLRQIDWKATTRARRLISREYQEERNQHIVIMLDSGRRMLAHDGVLSHFDHVLNAALVLSYLALRQGDSVAVQTFGGPSRWIPPVRGVEGVDRIIQRCFDVQPAARATDYLAAAREVVIRQPRRSLVVMVTNVRDEDGEELHAAIELLRRRHLICVASLRESVLDQRLANAPGNLNEAIDAASVVEYLAARRHAHDALRARGITALDVTCDILPAALVEHYLSVKRSGRL